MARLSNNQKMMLILHKLMCSGEADICAWWMAERPLDNPENDHTKQYTAILKRLEGKSKEEIIDILRALYGPEKVDQLVYLANEGRL